MFMFPVSFFFIFEKTTGSLARDLGNQYISDAQRGYLAHIDLDNLQLFLHRFLECAQLNWLECDCRVPYMHGFNKISTQIWDSTNEGIANNAHNIRQMICDAFPLIAIWITGIVLVRIDNPNAIESESYVVHLHIKAFRSALTINGRM